MAAKDKKSALDAFLRNAILTMELQPGTALDEHRLGEEFGLSRTPVREVFRALDGLGYVTLADNRGARVSDLSPATLRDFFLAAPMIYSAILRLAARNRRPDQLADLREAQARFREALNSGNVGDRSLANYRFHEVTGEMSGNTYLLPSFHRLLIDHARIGMTFYSHGAGQMADNLATASAQHDAIIDAIAAGDEAEAARLADAHWDLSRGQIQMFVMPDAVQAGLGADLQRTSA